ncbi:Uncharacterised protein [Klebsiella pneumoniae]|nr:Uncharacterised protein [Klebsiella pneumoniae]VGD29271.1 Uncharacterised protein [Klebsiella pneumoniae]
MTAIVHETDIVCQLFVFPNPIMRSKFAIKRILKGNIIASVISWTTNFITRISFADMQRFDNCSIKKSTRLMVAGIDFNAIVHYITH